MIPEGEVHAQVVFAGVSSVVPVGDRRPREVAEEVGVTEATIYRWTAQEAVDLGERQGVRSGERAELSQARARIKELEVTRKASAIFEEQEGRRAVRPKGSTR